MNTVAVEVKHLSKKFQIDKNKDISVLRDTMVSLFLY